MAFGCGDDQIEPAIAQMFGQIDRTFFAHDQSEFGETLVELAGRWRQKIGANGGKDAEINAAFEVFLALTRESVKLFDLAQNIARADNNIPACRGEHSAMATTFQKACAQLFFHVCNLR